MKRWLTWTAFDRVCRLGIIVVAIVYIYRSLWGK
jgi:hypothetical protein